MRIHGLLPPQRGKRPWVVMAFVVAGFALAGGIAHEGLQTHNQQTQSQLQPMATTDDISVAGYGPGDVALSWQQSGDWCFTDYRIQDSTSGSSGPWTTVDTFTSSGITSMYLVWVQPGPDIVVPRYR